MSINKDIKSKISKIMNQAEDRAGTPESEVFMSKAFDIMAQYGISEFEMDQYNKSKNRHKDAQGNYITNGEIAFNGKYTKNQAHLLTVIADCFNCSVISFSLPRSSKYVKAHIFGTQQSIEKTVFFYNILLPFMMNQAALINKNNVPEYSKVRSFKTSFMTGFINAIRTRLNKSINDVVEGNKGYELALINEREMAIKASRESVGNSKIRPHKSSSVKDIEGYMRGSDAAMNVDIDSGDRVGSSSLKGIEK